MHFSHCAVISIPNFANYSRIKSKPKLSDLADLTNPDFYKALLSPIASSKQNELLSAINEIKARCLVNFVLVQDILLFAHKEDNFRTLFL